MPVGKKRPLRKSSRASARAFSRLADGAILRLAIGAVLLGMTWAAVPLAKAITNAIVSTDVVAFQARVTSPATGAVITDPIIIEASLSHPASAGYFQVSGGTVTSFPLQAGADKSDPLIWRATFSPGALPFGTYALTFSAVRATDGATVTSAPVSVTTKSASAGTATNTVTTATDTKGTDTATTTTTTTSTAAQQDAAPLAYSVQFLAPSANATLSGDVTLKVGVNHPIDYLTYVVTPLSGGGIVELPATMDANSAWVGTWKTAGFPNGTYNVVARAFHAAVVDFSDPLTLTVSNANAPASFAVTLGTPTAGASVNGTVTLSASTNIEATGVTFTVRNSSGSLVATVPGLPASGNKQWNAVWDTTGVPNGAYAFRASGIKTGAQAETTDRAFTVSNQVDTTVFATTVVAPTPGSVVNGSAQMYVQTSLPADKVVFTLKQTFGAQRAIDLAGQGGPTSWYVTWDATGWEAGTYVLRAKGTRGTEITESGEVQFSLNAPTSANPEVSSTAVRVTLPATGAIVSGITGIAARTDGAVDAVTMLIKVTTGDASPVATLNANGSDGNTSWTVPFNTTSVPNGVYSVVAVSTKGGVKTSSVGVPMRVDNVVSVANAVPSFEIRQPASGATVNGTVPITVVASAALDSLAVVIEGPAVVGGRVAIPAVGNSTKTSWTATWNSLDVKDGNVTMRAIGNKGGRESEGAPRTVTVTNATKTTETTTPPVTTQTKDAFGVTVRQPISGATVYGDVPLSATVQGTAIVVRFVVSAPTGGVISNAEAKFDATTKEWTSVMRAAAMGDGPYDIVATAQNSGGLSVQSGKVRVNVQKVAPVTVTEKPAETTSPVTSQETKEELLSVGMFSPTSGSSLRGAAVLSANASAASAVRFLVRPASGSNEPRSVPASRADGTLWKGFIDTTGLPDGDYAVSAEASNAAGSSVRSSAVTIKIANARPIDVVTKVDVIPDAAVIAAVRAESDAPKLEKPEVPKTVTDAQQALNAQCVANNIGPDRCAQWIASRATSNACTDAGIVTKEECVAFLNARFGAGMPGCASVDGADCASTVATETATLLSDSDLRLLRETMIPQIGQVMELPPKDNPTGTGGAMPVAPPAMIQHAPLRSDKPINMRVHASYAQGETDGAGDHQMVPVVLMVDTDGDGLPDDVELRLGTDPRNPDTDGDGYTDGQEVASGYNPLGDGQLADHVKLAPVDVAIISGVPMEQPKESGTQTEDLKVESARPRDEKGGSFILAGHAKPGDIVTVFVYSYLPVVFTTTAQEDGSWSYDLGSSLSDGQHEAYATVTDDTGKIAVKSSPLAFFVSGASAVTEEDFFSPQQQSPLAAAVAAEPARKYLGLYLGAAALVVIAGLGLAFFLLFRAKRTPPMLPPQ